MTNYRILVLTAIIILLFTIPFVCSSGSDDYINQKGHPLSNHYGRGNVTESFNNPSNTTLFNATVINDGNLTITGMYHKADFDDGTLQGWTGGASTIVDGHLRTWGDSGAQMYVNVADFRLDLDLSMAKLGDLGGGEGFRIRLYGDYGWTLYFNYDTKLDELVVAQQEYDDYKELKRISFIGEKGRWYHVNIDHNRNRFTIKMDDLTVADVYISPFTSMTRFHIGAWWEEVLYDNVTIHAPNTRGHAFSLTSSVVL